MALDVFWRRVADLVRCLGIPEVPYWRQINGRKFAAPFLIDNVAASEL